MKAVANDIGAGLRRLYVLYRATVGGCSSAEIASDLRTRGMATSRASASQLLRHLEFEGYLSSVSPARGEKRFRATARGLAAARQLPRLVRALMK